MLPQSMVPMRWRTAVPGKGNDQVRFDVAIAALNPNIKVLTPAREWGMSREETIAYGGTVWY